MVSSLSRSKRHELTAALNGYRTELSDNYISNKSNSLRSIYHDKISYICNEQKQESTDCESRQQKLMKDRLSFYDNYEDDQDFNDYKFSNNNKPKVIYKTPQRQQIQFDSSEPTTSIDETTMNNTSVSSKHERDDFDDLIDLTHRIPKKVFKRINHIVNSSSSLNCDDTNSWKCKSPVASSSYGSKTSLPPLPYSFVNLSEKKQQQQVERAHTPKTTTRLIIPLVNYQDELTKARSSNCILNSSSTPTTPNHLNYSSSSSSYKENIKPVAKKSSYNIPNRSKSIETNKEWDQITKIFDSLETLLNEVVNENTKTNSIPNTPIVNTRKKELGTSYNYEPFLKSTNSLSLFPVKKKETTNFTKSNSTQFSTLSSHSLQTNNNKKSLSTKNLKQKEICDFLARIFMSKYEMKFIANGYDDVNFLNGVVNLQDLLQIGVENYDDALRILQELKYLSTSIKQIESERFNKVEDLLRFLHLKEYTNSFIDKNVIFIEELIDLCEVELTTVIKIQLCGHKRRLAAAMQLLLDQKIHKNQQKQQQQSSISSQSVTPLSHLYHKDYQFNNGLESSSVSSYSSSSYNTLCNTSTSYKQLPAKIDLKKSNTASTSYITTPIKTVKFATELSFDTINQEYDSNSSPEFESSSSQASKLEHIPMDRKSPKPIWRSDPKNLIRNSCNFMVNYLGSSALIKTKNNQDPVKNTIDRLKKTSKNTPYQSPKVELAVSIGGVKLLNCKNKELLWHHDIKHINNVCQDQDDLNYFAFSTQTDPGAYYYCHVFACKDKELSTQIILTIGQAFDLAYELFCKNNMT